MSENREDLRVIAEMIIGLDARVMALTKLIGPSEEAKDQIEPEIGRALSRLRGLPEIQALLSSTDPPRLPALAQCLSREVTTKRAEALQKTKIGLCAPKPISALVSSDIP